MLSSSDLSLLDWMLSSSSNESFMFHSSSSDTSTTTTTSTNPIQSYEEQITKQPYDVTTWMNYMDVIDDRILFFEQQQQQENNTNKNTKKQPATKLIPITTMTDDDDDADDTNTTTGTNNQQTSTATTTTTTTTTKYYTYHSLFIGMRELIGRRACYYLPKSYKLWKHVWEFLLVQYKKKKNRNQILQQQQQIQQQIQQQQQQQENDCCYIGIDCHLIIKCFECSIRTLSNFPRLWVVYIQWWIQQINYYSATTTTTTAATTGTVQLLPPSILSITHLRHVIDRALSSIAITQHDKIWTDSTLLDFLFEYNNNNNNNNNNTATNDKTNFQSLIPCETIYRLLRRYCTYNNNNSNNNNQSSTTNSITIRFAQWCEKYKKYGPAAIAYQTIFNNSSGSSHTNPTSEQQQYENWISFCDLVIEHSEYVEMAGIPWESILRTAIAQQVQLYQKKNQTNTNQSQKKKDFDVVNTAATTTNSSLLLGLLYSQLATVWINRGMIDLARTVYEEGLYNVYTVRDFSILYTAYMSLEDGILNILYDQMNNNENKEEEDENYEEDQGGGTLEDDDNDDWDILLLDEDNDDDDDNNDNNNNNNRFHKKSNSHRNNTLLADMELAIARAEHLTVRRPILLNAVQLRQNPNNVDAWLERATLYMEQNQQQPSVPVTTSSSSSSSTQYEQAAAALEEGLLTITNNTTLGISTTGGTTTYPISTMVRKLIQIYEEYIKDIDRAVNVFQRICYDNEIAIASIDDGASIWSEYIEFSLRLEQYDNALSLSRQSVNSTMLGQISTSGSKKKHRTDNAGGSSSTSSSTIYMNKSLRLWNLLLDLEESLGTVQTTKDAYNRVIETKVATIQHILNYASFLKDHQYYEESFSIYERGIELFPFTQNIGVKVLWKSFIQSFMERYNGTKMERTRNIFQRCFEQCPASECAEFYTMYGEFEEEYGLTKRALSVYRDMCQAVPSDEKYTAYQLYIIKTIKYLGITATRDIYQEAIEILKDSKSFCQMCIDFAKMETSLQQIERSRAVYTYGSQLADPRRIPEYWKEWNDFEIAYGNEETFRDMLRIKRSVEAAFSTVNYNATGMLDKVENLSNEEAMRMIANREGVELDTFQQHEPPTSTGVAGFVAAVSATTSSNNKRGITNLEDVEERVAKLRKATGTMLESNPDEINLDDASSNIDHDGDDDNEIDIDDIDAEIEEAAAEGEAAMMKMVPQNDSNDSDGHDSINNDDDKNRSGSVHLVKNVKTKAVPKSVFGGLANIVDNST